MSDVEFSRTEQLSREETAKMLSALAEALGGDGHAHLRLGDSTVGLRVPGQLRAEVEVEVDGDEVELEIELKWSLDGAARRGRQARQ